MKSKIFKSASVLVVLSVLLTFFVMNFIMYKKTMDEMKTSVQVECGYIKNAVEASGTEYLTREVCEVSPSRLTLIREDGTVLFDSAEQSGNLENHKERPEFEEAIQKGEGSDLRSSTTLGEQTYYYARKLKDGNVIRVARTTDTVFKSLESGFFWMVGLMILIGVLAVGLVDITARRLIEPINKLDLSNPLDNVEYEELSPLVTRIDHQNKQIREQLRQLKQNQEEYLAITEYMKDGLIVTNRHVVLSINRSAQELFHVTMDECINHDIITVSRNEELKEAFQIARTGESNDRIVEIQGRTYHILANPVRAGKVKVTGVVILILDVTEKRAAELMRREFSANVSHELKTPLMSISGYAEIIENGMVRKEDIPGFAGRIHSEASRLTSLVEDIIKLSRLDENDDMLPKEEVDLLAVAKEVERRLMFQAKDAKITLSVEGETAVISGVRQVLYEMLFNLCDNAIKYNHPGGSVWVSILKKQDGKAEVKVRDDGIGIAPEHQERIFERFYRVDKSHSRETGGTGLGLSIVKHGALLHDAKLTLESAPGKGTGITLLFA